MSSDAYTYPGEELLFFEKAVNWKRYFARHIQPFIGHEVLEVGSGIGGTTSLLNDGTASLWVLLEPDAQMNSLLQQKIKEGILPANCQTTGGSIHQFYTAHGFDTIIYIDVLEHIEDDRKEIDRVSELLKPNGHLIVLSPAFQFLYSPFDKAIGHYRRYNKRSLKAVLNEKLKQRKLIYLDSMGYFASVTNKLFLKQAMPTEAQVRFWDDWLIPLSRIADPLFMYAFGKSIIGIWQKK
jgi:ubiquinone/menaquinone biosynthesis C-methylase UbiE